MTTCAGTCRTASLGFRWGALLLAVCLGLIAVPSASASFCETGVVKDYLAPLKRLPKLRTLQWPDKDLPFGPSGLKLVKTADAQRANRLVVVGEGPRSRPVGFTLMNDSSGSPGRADLDWLMTGQLVRVSGGDRILATKTRRVDTLRPDDQRRVAFPMPSRPGIYRIEISFEGESDSSLGHYADYFRVMPAKQETQVSLSTASVRPGETIDACLINSGTASVSYGEGFTIEYFDGSTWSRAPISPAGAISMIGLVAGPGEQIRLPSFYIPSNPSPGLYRYVWDGMVRPAQPIVLSPEFWITSG